MGDGDFLRSLMRNDPEAIALARSLPAADPNAGGYLVPATFIAELMDMTIKVRKASKGYRRHARRLKRKGQWTGQNVSPRKKMQEVLQFPRLKFIVSAGA